jgi:hypothetical protein
MLKAAFTPYSDKLRQASQRRRIVANEYIVLIHEIKISNLFIDHLVVFKLVVGHQILVFIIPLMNKYH